MGGGTIEIRTVAARPMAAVRRRVTAATAIDEMVRSPIWNLPERLRALTLDQAVLLYHDFPTRLLHTSPAGVDADIGVLVRQPFDNEPTLSCVMTPSGRVAYARHHGHWTLLPYIHDDIHAWCASEGHTIAGPHWEHYAVWHEDETRRVTDIYYLLA